MYCILTLYSLQCTMYLSLSCAVHLYTLQSAVYCVLKLIVYCSTLKHSTVYSLQCTVYLRLKCTVYLPTLQKIVYCVLWCVYYRAQNLRQGIVMNSSFGTWVSQMGLPSFVDIILFSFFIFYHFFRSLKSKSTDNKTPKRKL